MVAWILRELLSHSVEEYVLAIGELNPSWVINMVAKAAAVYVRWNCNLYSSSNLSDVRPKSVPALELHSKAESSVGVMYCSCGPNTGSNPRGRQILKKSYLFAIFWVFALE